MDKSKYETNVHKLQKSTDALGNDDFPKIYSTWGTGTLMPQYLPSWFSNCLDYTEHR